MGADLYLNPPAPESLDKQVKRVMDECAELRKDNSRLAQELRDKDYIINALKLTIRNLTNDGQ